MVFQAVKVPRFMVCCRMSNLYLCCLPSGEFRNSRQFAAGILNPFDYQIFIFAACLRGNSDILALGQHLRN